MVFTLRTYAASDVHLKTPKFLCVNLVYLTSCCRLLKPLLLQLLFVPLYTVFLGVTARCLQSLSVVLLHFDSQLQALRSQIQVCAEAFSLYSLTQPNVSCHSNICRFCSFDVPQLPVCNLVFYISSRTKYRIHEDRKA